MKLDLGESAMLDLWGLRELLRLREQTPGRLAAQVWARLALPLNLSRLSATRPLITAVGTYESRSR